MIKADIRIEKRILPLLDITVILVGILILVIGNPEMGGQKNYLLTVSGSQVFDQYGVVAENGELDPDRARALLDRAFNGGYRRIDIQNEEERHQLSGVQITKIEKDLQLLAAELADERGRPQTLTIRFTYK